MKRLIRDYEYSQEQLNTIRGLANACGLNEITARILYARGVDTKEKAERFLSPSRAHFLSPFLMSGMRELKALIDETMAAGGHILVFGDYDADGVCASSILLSALLEYGADASAYVPERAEGYGMKEESLARLIDERNPSLVISVDCGISNRREVEYVCSRGVKIVVTDHHELPDELPSCVIVNPKLKDDYPYDNLCGAGVAFKVACALLGEKAYKLLDLAAIATVADSVPLLGENRDIVSEGLKLINKKPREAISLLVGSKGETLSAQSLAFVIAPRINAAGRMGDAGCALRLFTARSSAETYELACKLNEYNIERQQACDEVYKSAKEKIAREGAFGNVIMLFDEEWNTGLVGIVAAKICEEFNRPAILFVRKGDLLKGSARTVEGINIYEALRACSQYIEEFGGHSQAAGVNVRAENFEKLKDALGAYLEENYGEETYIPAVSVAERIEAPVSLRLAKEFERLEPFGVGNKKPLFYIEGNKLEVRRLKAGSPHLGIRCEYLDLVWFGGERAMPVLGADIGKKIVVECSVSKFRGSEYVRGTVRELIAGERGGSCGLYVFRSNLLRLKEPKVGVGIEKKTADELRAFIEEKRKACRYGLLVLSSDGAADEFAESLRGMETDIFNLSSQNVGNAYLIAPAADASVSGYRDVVWLDTPADCNIRELAGKRVLVNGEKCGYDDIAALETSRSFLAELYSAVRSKNLRGESSVEAALAFGEGYDEKQTVFALEVFAELGFIRFENNKVCVARGVRAELADSTLYQAVCRLKGE